MAEDEPLAAGGAGDGSHGLENRRAPWEEEVEDPATPRALLAVMFNDIVGSTELARCSATSAGASYSSSTTSP
ncbi:MAG: hypothetical protein ACRDKS_18220 [Actinomycetota bacterium]